MLRAGRAMLAAGMVACTTSDAAWVARPEERVALIGARVIDGTGAAPRVLTVILNGSHIEAVFEPGARPIPADARMHDLTGRYIIPGLIDTHVHLGTQPRERRLLQFMARTALLGGVTAVRDMGGSHTLIRDLAHAAARPGAESPSIYYSAVMAGPGTMWFTDTTRAQLFADGYPLGRAPGIRMVRSASDVEDAIAGAVASGASGIKLYDRIPPAIVAALVTAAHDAGLRVWSHGIVPPTSPGQLIELGIDVLSHADQPVWSLYGGTPDSIGNRTVRERLLATLPASSPDVLQLLGRMRERGTILEPTLTIMMGDNPDQAVRTPLVRWAVEFTRAAHHAGVRIAAGTDAMNARGAGFPNIHTEMQLLVEHGGLSPLDAITAATHNAALAIGADSIGMITPGKRADIVILAADPSTDIRNTREVVTVVRGGIWHQPPPPARSQSTGSLSNTVRSDDDDARIRRIETDLRP